MVDSNLLFEGSKRLRKFRETLTNKIPRIPNNRASLQALQSKDFLDFLIVYICWRWRHVGIRPRKVMALSVLDSDPRSKTLKPNIDAFTKTVEVGADLRPYLSKRVNREGYVMDADPERTNTATWEDKDFLLNVMGFHHFHLGIRQQASGLMDRTDEVIFAHVSRDTFKVLGLFDHTVFDWTVDDEMAPEREKLWSIHDVYQAAPAGPRGISMGGLGGLGITMDGTPTIVTMVAMNQIRLIREIDPRLDEPQYVEEKFAEFPVTGKIKPAWHYSHLDFGLLNEATGHFKCLMPGPN